MIAPCYRCVNTRSGSGLEAAARVFQSARHRSTRARRSRVQVGSGAGPLQVGLLRLRPGEPERKHHHLAHALAPADGWRKAGIAQRQ